MIVSLLLKKQQLASPLQFGFSKLSVVKMTPLSKNQTNMLIPSSYHIGRLSTKVPFALLKKQAETLFRLICCEREILFRLKKQAKKDGLIREANMAKVCKF